MLHTTQTSQLYMYVLLEAELLPIKVLYCTNRDFRPFLFPWPSTWPDDLHTGLFL